MAAKAAARSGAGGCVDGTLAMTRCRSARIDRLVDMIPARFYLGGDCQHVLQNHHWELDPAHIKTTSQMVAEAAKLSGSEKAASSSGASGSKAGKKKKLRSSAISADAVAKASGVNSREELKKKLAQRISEMREERIRKQSEIDKARSAGVHAKEEKPGSAQATNGNALHSTSRKRPVEDIEIGRLSYDRSTAELPFEADAERKGNKVRKRQEALRQEEANQRRLREVESQGGDVDDLRKELLMKKALKRASGDKVHDDMSKLRKAQKHYEVKKARGQEKWKKRKEEEKSQQEDRQTQRKDNLQKRVSNKKKKKGGEERSAAA